jgi:NTE family protein
MADKVGLALSGGGFRAAFFHVGALARLAETGVLRRVEVISTVSGGSIVGAAYYIRLKRLLESTPDADITDDDYCRVVVEVEQLLRDAVRKDIRGLVFRNLFKNLMMVMPGAYSRSHRVGDLYDRHLYKAAWEEDRPRKGGLRGGAERQIELRELLIQPCGAREDFRPDEHNGSRDAKVPILLVNATTLNTGRNWRFEAVRMGEPVPTDQALGEVVRDVDKNMRLEQGYFDPTYSQHAIPEERRDYPLALAVAASACVPGLFHPVDITKVYEGIRVRLVDGGVHDNQGVQGLFDNGCDLVIASDASHQLADKEKPSARIWKVLGRTLGIQGDRVRDEQLVRSRRKADEVVLLHLRKGLSGRVVVPGQALHEADSERVDVLDTETFGVSAEVQEALSQIRTDLDFFSDIEAFSLSLDGYLMMRQQLARPDLAPIQSSPYPPSDPGRWQFDAMGELISEGSGPHMHHLEHGRRRFLRIFHLLLPGFPVTILAVLLGLAGTVFLGCVLGVMGWSWLTWLVAGVLALLLGPFMWANALWPFRGLAASAGNVPAPEGPED